MKRTSGKNIVENMLQTTDIRINGSQPWDIQVYNEDLYSRVMTQGTRGLGEAYMDKWWDCEHLDMLFDKLLKARLDTQITLPLPAFLTNMLAKIVSFQTREKAKEVAHQHYNLNSALFGAMLDKNRIYSCAYFKDASTLEEAQIAKLELSCQKLKLKPGMRLLDIGCGWGGLAKYAAENFKVEVVGITISEEQQAWAKEYCKNLDVDIRLQDYRDIHETFDRIISIGMFEHVGPLNYKTFMGKTHELLVDQGLFLLHTIGSTEVAPLIDPWIREYIFPNGVIPAASQIAAASEPFFVMEDWQNFGAYYDRTLMAWHQNFVDHWDSLKTQFDERFYRMWSYYLLSSAGSFRARTLQLWQTVFSKGGIAGGYMAVR